MANFVKSNHYETRKPNPELKHAEKLQIFVKLLSNKFLAMDVRNSEKIEEVLVSLQERTQIPKEEMRLLFSGKQLDCLNTIHFYNIQKGSTLNMMLRLNGGMNFKPNQFYIIILLSKPNLIFFD